jgi:transcription elongation factor GreA
LTGRIARAQNPAETWLKQKRQATCLTDEDCGHYTSPRYNRWSGMEELKKKLREEIAQLENELRIELPKEILKARAHGDLSENAEYHAAKERQGYVNARLGQLNARLRTISMIDMSKIPHDRVGLGSTVVVLDIDKDEKLTYKLVTSEDVDVGNGAISTSSPIGRGLLGKQVGDTVKIQIPGGLREMEIVELKTIHQTGG